jgi:hypothetical protein
VRGQAQRWSGRRDSNPLPGRGIKCPKEPLRFDAAGVGNLEVNRGRHRPSLDRAPWWPCDHSVSRPLPDPGVLPDRASACSAPSGKTHGTVPGRLPQAACPPISSGRGLIVHQLRIAVDKAVDKSVDKSLDRSSPALSSRGGTRTGVRGRTAKRAVSIPPRHAHTPRLGGEAREPSGSHRRGVPHGRLTVAQGQWRVRPSRPGRVCAQKGGLHVTSRLRGARLRLVVVVSMAAAALVLAPSVAVSPVAAAQTLTQGCTPNGSSSPLSGGFRAGRWVTSGTQGSVPNGSSSPLSGGFRAGQWVTSGTQGCSPGDLHPLSGGYRAGHWVP